jgi:hypothetical protein
MTSEADTIVRSLVNDLVWNVLMIPPQVPMLHVDCRQYVDRLYLESERDTDLKRKVTVAFRDDRKVS